MNTSALRPAGGEKITLDSAGALVVPAVPIVPFIEVEGVGPDVIPVMRRVVDAAVTAAYGSARRLVWMPVAPWADPSPATGLPQQTLEVLREHVVWVKGPVSAATDAALREGLRLFVRLRPVSHYEGVPSPLREPEAIDMAVFHEVSEDAQAGAEWEPGSLEAIRLIGFITKELGVASRGFAPDGGIAVRPIAAQGSERLVRLALRYTVEHDKPSVTLVHDARGRLLSGGYALASREFGATPLDGGPWQTFRNPRTGRPIVVKDAATDDFLQQILLRPAEHSVVAALNRNGAHLADAIAAEAGIVGMAPGASLGEGAACFEVTHGPASKYAGKDYVNPGSAILSAELMLRHLGWTEAADRINRGLRRTLAAKRVTYDLARLMEGATQVSCSGFGQAVVDAM